jgi:TolB-like protein/Tfp pilus assembly protein PilF
MPDSNNRLSQFWQELKRRKVVRIITVYAAAAFVILQLIEILAPSLRLPEWTMNFILVLLIVGFIIAVILSWIYDIHPEGGIVKTEPADKVKKEEIRKTSNSWKIASYISFIVIAGLIALNMFGGKKHAGIDESLEKSIAVLPFHNLSGDDKQEYICMGITDEIISHLFKVRSFEEVRSLTSVLPFNESQQSIIEIAQELHVNYILTGTYKRMGDDLRITAQLIETKSDNHIWLEDYDLPYQEVIGIPTEIALQIANQLKAFISEDEQQRIETIPTENLDAYEYYMLGKSQLYGKERDAGLWQAVEYYQKALTADPSFALAHSGLAEVYLRLTTLAIAPPKEAYRIAKTSALKALSLDNGLANAHSMLALTKVLFEYDFDSAEEEFMRALEIDSRSFEAHLYYAGFLSMMGRHDEALSHINLAVEIDPFSTLAEEQKINMQYYAGNKSEALEAIEKFTDSNPSNPGGFSKRAIYYSHMGRYEEAISMLNIQIDLMGENNISDEIGIRGYIYGKLGQRARALEHLDELEMLSTKGYYISPRTRVWIYLGIDETEAALEILNKALNDNIFDPVYLNRYPSEYVQHDPGFIELQKKVGLIE